MEKETREGVREEEKDYFHSSLPNLTISAISKAQYFPGALPSSTIRAAATAALPIVTGS